MSATAFRLFVRYVLIPLGASYANWDSIRDTFARFVEEPDQPDYGRYAQFVFSMKDAAGTFTTRERGMIGLHYLNTTGGDPDYTWTTTDFTAVEGAFVAMVNALAGTIPSAVRWDEARWYKFGPGIFPPNPPVRVQALSGTPAGAAAEPFVRQVACAVTLKTALRRHWGRFYLPIGTGFWATNGQISNASADEIAGAVRTFLLAPETSQGITPVIWDRHRKAALGVTEIQVDSVPDIIRRRRARTTRYRKQLAA